MGSGTVPQVEREEERKKEKRKEEDQRSGKPDPGPSLFAEWLQSV